MSDPEITYNELALGALDFGADPARAHEIATQMSEAAESGDLTMENVNRLNRIGALVRQYIAEEEPEKVVAEHLDVSLLGAQVLGGFYNRTMNLDTVTAGVLGSDDPKGLVGGIQSFTFMRGLMCGLLLAGHVREGGTDAAF